MTHALKSPPLSATILVLVGIAILCALGTWQLQRLEWKSDLLTQIQSEQLRDASSTPLYADTPDMQRGFVTGIYMNDKTIYIMPRTHEGAPGYHVITPLLMNNDRSVLVNRGWIPLEMNAELTTPEGLVHIEGVLRSPSKTNMFTPKNAPDKNQWYSIDLDQMTSAMALTNPWQKILYAEKNTDNAEFPIASPPLPNLKNNHAGYAFFWFAMACALAGVFFARFMWVGNKER